MPDDKQTPEDWAWAKIRAGEIADFNARFGKLDPRKPEGWKDDRKLGAGFLRELFFGKPDRGEVPIEGARVIGAYLPEGQVLHSGSVSRDVWLEQCRSEKPIDLQSETLGELLFFEGSWAGEAAGSASVCLAHSHIGRSLNLLSPCPHAKLWAKFGAVNP